ncbi:MAG TPA: extracellular solute-binding protein [Chloroflexota bacterium]
MPNRTLSPDCITRRRFLTLAGVAGLALAACGGNAQPGPSSTAPAATSVAPAASGAQEAAIPQQMIDAAKKEGPLTFYSSTTPNTIQHVADAFKARYGIEIQFTRLASTPMAQRYAAEAEAGNIAADVVQISDQNFFEQAVTKGWLAKLDNLPALATYPKDSWNGTFAKAHIGLLSLMWNTTVVQPADAPKGWEDVLKPVFKGKILLVDLRNAPILWSWGLALMKTYGEDFLKKLGAQEPRLVASSVPGSQQLAAGAGALLVPGTHSDTLELQKDKAPIQEIIPSPAVGNESFVGVSTKAPHPNGARLLFNFIISPEAQSIYVKDGYASVLTLPGADPLPPGYVSPSPKEALAASTKMLDLLGIH